MMTTLKDRELQSIDADRARLNQEVERSWNTFKATRIDQ